MRFSQNERGGEAVSVRQPQSKIRWICSATYGVLALDPALHDGVGSDGFGPVHCYGYMYNRRPLEAPTLRLNPGDTLALNFF